MENAKTSAPQWIAQRQVHTGRKHKVKCTAGGARKDKCTGSHADGEALFPSLGLAQRAVASAKSFPIRFWIVDNRQLTLLP